VTADKDGLLVAVTEIHDRTDEECDANARRIVAAVNACEGIATSALEQGVVAEMLEACKAALTDYEATMPDATSMRAILHAVIATATGGAA